MLNVTKAYLPPREKFDRYIDAIWESHVLTNNGAHLQMLEERLTGYSGCNDVLVCTNGTIVLQLALRALNITKEVITTPFSYVATVNSILWEGGTPVFVDVNANDLTIDVDKIEAAINANTQAILATHVYGHPCNVDRIQAIAGKYGLRVIYDAANAFGTFYKGRSIFSFGDISTCSFHATKLFHSAEGGALFVNNREYSQQLSLYRSFGHVYDDYFSVGINAKMSELHAAMGLCVLDDIDDLIEKRRTISEWYDRYLERRFRYMNVNDADTRYNYAYYPVLLESEQMLMSAMSALAERDILPRRYFYPSLNKLPFLNKTNACPVSEDIAQRVLCLPLSHYVVEEEVRLICSILNAIK